MRLPDAFIRVAERSLEAGEAVLAKALQEKAAFLAYHSFESCGGAYCSSRAIKYHPIPHPEKLRRFAQASSREKFALHVSRLAIELLSLRNLLLYPREHPGGTCTLPEGLLSLKQAERLLGRVRALTVRVKAVV